MESAKDSAGDRKGSLVHYGAATSRCRPPMILIGHSLGGAAVLAAAERIPEAKAVVTIGAPADVAHVLRQLDASLDRIRSEGEAEVKLAGRSIVPGPACRPRTARARIFASAGQQFGPGGETWLRFNSATLRPILTEALERSMTRFQDLRASAPIYI